MMRRTSARGLPFLLLTSIAGVACAEESFKIDYTATPELHEGKACVLVKGTTTFPERSILGGRLLFERDNFSVELHYRREAVGSGGAFQILLESGMSGSLFPGTYAVLIEFDPSGQYPAVLAKVGRDVRNPITRRLPLPVGTPEEQKEAVEKRRQEWVGRFDELTALGDELAARFHAQAKKADPGWGAWLAGWRARLQKIQSVDVGPGELQVIPFLHAYRNARDSLVHILQADLSAHCETALQKSPPDAADVARMDQWFDFYRRSCRIVFANVRLTKPDQEKALGGLSRLHDLIQAMAAWHAAWKSKPEGTDWPKWRDEWRNQRGFEMLQFAGAGLQGLDVEFMAFADTCTALEEAVDKSVSHAADAPPVDAAVEKALNALSEVGAKMAQRR